MVKKKISIDDLARMVAEGFKHTATKEDLKGMKEELELKIDALEERLDRRLSTVEFLLSSNRIERIEDDMRRVKTVLKIK
ncbi:MAG TPA: hypothetical protein VJH55_03255 [Candidatus Paceibacterota bacterium]